MPDRYFHVRVEEVHAPADVVGGFWEADEYTTFGDAWTYDIVADTPSHALAIVADTINES